MSRIGARAVVLGGSMGGLLAARVLAEFYDAVTVVERDVLPAEAAHRRGVPQSRHVHGLLSTGSQVLGELFPGLLDELSAAGATVLDDGDLSRVSMTLGGHRLDRCRKFDKPLVSYLASRPFLEAHVRRRVCAIENVTVLDGHDAVEIIASGSDRVTGARVARHDTGEQRVVDADLVVDAMGRAARTPAFLDSIGYGRPLEDRIAVQVAYASQLLQIPSGTLRERLILVAPVPERPSGGALFAYENDTWMLTLAGMTGYEPPTDRAGMLRFANDLGVAELVSALTVAQPVGDVCQYRYPVSVRRRYEKMRRFPAGLLVFGDAICSFNPVYGQGMSVAALEAIALRDCLVRGRDNLSRRFFCAAAKRVDVAWQMAAGADLALPQVEGPRTLPTRLSNWYTDQVLTAAASDGAVAEGFFRVMNMADSPSRLLHPSFVMRVAAANRRRPRRDARGAPEPAGVTRR